MNNRARSAPSEAPNLGVTLNETLMEQYTI
ncbi:MAG: hypothetical protein ACI906_001617 [Candidatus Latescibacterota bacterium]|jgi:hypothetical protein